MVEAEAEAEAEDNDDYDILIKGYEEKEKKMGKKKGSQIQKKHDRQHRQMRQQREPHQDTPPLPGAEASALGGERSGRMDRWGRGSGQGELLKGGGRHHVCWKQDTIARIPPHNLALTRRG